MVHKRENPEDWKPENKSAQPHKRRRPKTLFSRAGLTVTGRSEITGKKTILDKDNYLWTHEMTADDEPTANRMKRFLEKKHKKECKIVRNGNKYEILVRKV